MIIQTQDHANQGKETAMEYVSSSPIWLQVMTDLERQIVTGKRPPGSKLPGGRDLAVEYGINPNTVSRVYQELEKSGLCETRRGLGTFVTGNTERIAALKRRMAREAIRIFLERMKKLGFTWEETEEMIRAENETGMENNIRTESETGTENRIREGK